MTDAVLFHGGPIHTFARSVPAPDALLIANGAVAAAGSLGHCRDAAPSRPEEVHLDGRTLMPGFVDPHVHLLLTGYALAGADLSEVGSIPELIEALTAQADRNSSAPVVTGYGYDQSRLAERRHPTRADLDRVPTDRPVQIQHTSGHGYAIDTTSLRRCGITAGTPTPTGGRIDRDEAGEPLGTIFDSACDLLTGPDGVKAGNHGPNFHLPLSTADEESLFALGQDALLRAGVTSICDAQVTSREMRAYLRARDENRLRLHTQLLALSSTLEHLEAIGLGSSLGDDRLRLLGVKLYADGSLTAGTAYIGSPHSCCGAPGPEGYLYHDPAELQQLIVAAHRLGLPTATHAQGEIPIGLVLDAVATAREQYPRPGAVHRIEHCGYPTETQIARMPELGIVPVPQPMQVHRYADYLIDYYGSYGGGLYPLGRFGAHGLPMIISSDTPVTMPGPLAAAWAATTRETRSGATADPDDTLRIGRGPALAGITTAPAALLGQPHTGHLAPGAAADLVLLDSDPVTCTTERLADAAVLQTWVAGEQAWPVPPS